MKVGRHGLHSDTRTFRCTTLVAVALAGFVTTSAKADENVRGSEYVSPKVLPLSVTVTPPPPAKGLAAPDARTRMVTVPEGEPLPTQAPPR